MNSPFFDDSQVHKGCTQCHERISWDYYRSFERPLCISCAKSLTINIALTNIIVIVSSIIGPSLVNLAASFLNFEFNSVSFITTYFIFAAPYGWTFLARVNEERQRSTGTSIKPFFSVYRAMKAIAIGWIVFPYELPQFIKSIVDLYVVNKMHNKQKRKVKVNKKQEQH